MMVKEITQTPQSALPLARLRAHLRLGSGFADEAVQEDLLAGFLRAALAAIEARTGQALMAREFEWRCDAWHGARADLPLAPVSALISAEIAAPRGDWRDIREAVWLSGDTLRAVGSALPVIPIGGQARLRLLAGHGPEFDDMPADLQQAVLLLAAHYHEFRDEVALSSGCMPFGVTALIERYRPLRIGLRADQ